MIVAPPGGRIGERRLLSGGHDPGFDVLRERVHRNGFLPDGKDWPGHYRAELTREARTVNREFAFEQGAVLGDFLVVVASDGFHDGLRLCAAQRADALRPLALTLKP